MIEIDEELKNRINTYDFEINEKVKQRKNQKIILELDCICYLLLYFFIIFSMTKNNFLIKNGMIIIILAAILFYLYLYITSKKNGSLNLTLNLLQKEIEDLETKRHNVMDFCIYLTSYRKIEAKKYGLDIYPEIYMLDSETSVNKFKDIYEQQRIEYEKNHIEFLKLNKYYLDEKLRKAPISSYPICEHNILKERQQELNKRK